MSSAAAGLRARLRRPRANPVLRRELVTRWRGRRAFVLLTLYLGVVGAVVVLLYQLGSEIVLDRARFDLVDPGPALGRFLFENLLALVLLLVLFIGPGYAAAQVVGERERQTLGLLQVTLVRPRSFVLGKLGASLAWLLLLVVATLPFAAATFFLGGVAPGEVVRGLVFVLGVAVAVAAMALGISAVVRTTTAAVVTTYGLVLVLTLGTLFAGLVEYTVLDSVDQFDDRSAYSLYANPYLGLTDAVRARDGFDEAPSVLRPFVEVLPAQNRRDRGFDDGFRGVAEPAIDALGLRGEDDAFLVDPAPDLVAELRAVAAESGQDPEVLDRAIAVGVDLGILEELAFSGFGLEEAVEVGLLPERVLALDGDEPAGPPRRSPVWLVVLGLYTALGVLGLVVATRRVAVPRRRRRPEPTTSAESEPVLVTGGEAGADT